MSTSSSSDTSAPSHQESALSKAEQSLLAVFRKFRVGQGEMLCFFGPTLDKHRRALASLTDQGMLVKERFRGGYALTPSGYAASRRTERFEDRHPTPVRR